MLEKPPGSPGITRREMLGRIAATGLTPSMQAGNALRAILEKGSTLSALLPRYTSAYSQVFFEAAFGIKATDARIQEKSESAVDVLVDCVRHTMMEENYAWSAIITSDDDIDDPVVKAYSTAMWNGSLEESEWQILIEEGRQKTPVRQANEMVIEGEINKKLQIVHLLEIIDRSHFDLGRWTAMWAKQKRISEVPPNFFSMMTPIPRRLFTNSIANQQVGLGLKHWSIVNTAGALERALKEKDVLDDVANAIGRTSEKEDKFDTENLLATITDHQMDLIADMLSDDYSLLSKVFRNQLMGSINMMAWRCSNPIPAPSSSSNVNRENTLEYQQESDLMDIIRLIETPARVIAAQIQTLILQKEAAVITESSQPSFILPPSNPSTEPSP